MAERAQWSSEQLAAASKKDIITFLKENASNALLLRHNLSGGIPNIIKTKGKPVLDAAYADLFASQEWRTENDDTELANKAAAATAVVEEATKPAEATTAPVKEAPKYTKVILKAGDRNRVPRKGDNVHIKFKGTVKETGHVFQDILADKKPFYVKVGNDQLIKGWDEAILTMCVGERAIVTIESEWAYGKKGKPEAKIPPNATLVFEMELMKVR